MAPTTDDLRLALRQQAEQTLVPAPHDLLAELRTARATGRRHTLLTSGLAAASVAAVAVLGWQAIDTAGVLGGRRTAPPAGTGAQPGDAVSRGWELDGRNAPEHADGLELLRQVEVPYSGGQRIELPAADHDGPRFAVVWCQTGPEDAAFTPPALALTTPGGDRTTVSCVPQGEDPASWTVTPLPLPEGAPSLDATWTGDVPADGAAVLGVYEEASWDGYPFPGWPDPPLTAPAHRGTAVITPASRALDPDEGSALLPSATAGTVRAVSATVDDRGRLEVWAGAPVQLQVSVDGILVTDDSEAMQDPEIRDGRWTAFTAGQRRVLDLPGELLPEPGQTRTVRIAAAGPASTPWQVAVLGTSPAPAAPARTTASEAVPEWLAGHRLVSSWTVPADGVDRTLAVPAGATGDARLVAICPDQGGASSGAGLLTVAVTDGDDRAQELPCAPDAATAGAWLSTPLDPSPAGGPAPSYGPVAQVEAGPALARVAPDGGTGSGEAHLAAYAPVGFDDFDHEAGEPAGPVGMDASMVDEIAAVGSDPHHRASTGTSVRLTRDITAVEMTSEGVGRVRILVDGEPLGTSDGWWTAWTDTAYTSNVPTGTLFGEPVAREGQTVTFQPEGYAEGSWSARLLAARGTMDR